MSTLPKVFIVESLDFEDEQDNSLDGYLLAQMLDIAHIKNDYYYIRTIKEYRAILLKFQESNARYLHISCHGNKSSLGLTLDSLEFNEFAKWTNPYLEKRRLFISSCETVNNNLAKHIMPISGCYSIIGPYTKIRFDDSAIVWASFYHLVLRDNAHMNQKSIKPAIRRLVDTFGVPINYYSIVNDRNPKHQTHSRQYLYFPNKPNDKDWIPGIL